MAAGYAVLDPRVEVLNSVQTGTITQLDTNSTSKQMLFDQLIFATTKSIRRSIIILATFNAIAAFVTAAGILYHCHSKAKRNNRRIR
jgi:hypothetical protein